MGTIPYGTIGRRGGITNVFIFFANGYLVFVR